MSEQEQVNTATTKSTLGGVLADLTKTTETAPILRGLSNLSIAKQLGLMLSIALSFAIGTAVVLWSQEDAYDLLYTGVDGQDVSEIADTLTHMGVDYKVDIESGAIMVPPNKVRELKLKLAAQGLPKTQQTGYEILDQEAAFGTSKNIELMRFQRALEGEIAKTITAIQHVKSARVLLALPKQSVFVRKRKKPSASVVLNLYQGRHLEKQQIEAIIHLVASSVPMMESTKVTVVDQQGRMLSQNDSSENMYLSSKQFEYKKNIEEHLMMRIENILQPLVGRAGMQAQVTADVDFTVTEQTQERFNPDLAALRSEQTQENKNSSNAIQGIAGALSNQPPSTAVAPEVVNQQTVSQTVTKPESLSKSATRNYELDKTITHTQLATGLLRRLSVAVVIDNKQVRTEQGNISNQAYTAEDIKQLKALVMQAVGFDPSRGDLVTVTNVAFRIPNPIEALPSIPLWEQSWFMSAFKQLLAVLVLVFLILAVLRPTVRGLIGRDEEVKALIDAHAQAAAIGGTVHFDKAGHPVAIPVEGVKLLDNSDHEGEPLPVAANDLLVMESPTTYEQRLKYVQKVIDSDSELVAQIMKGWVKFDV